MLHSFAMRATATYIDDAFHIIFLKCLLANSLEECALRWFEQNKAFCQCRKTQGTSAAFAPFQ
jgi:hypothetical protein